VNRITSLEPLCAMVMLRMTHAQLLNALFSDGDCSPTQAPGDVAATQEDDEELPGCFDDSSCHDFAALAEGRLSVTGVYRLSSHIRKCDTCKYLFASMICDVRHAKALDNFEDCDE
jgi:hypothetical protein